MPEDEQIEEGKQSKWSAESSKELSEEEVEAKCEVGVEQPKCRIKWATSKEEVEAKPRTRAERLKGAKQPNVDMGF